MNKNEKRKNIIRICIFIMSISLILLGVSYSFLTTSLKGTKSQIITAAMGGNLELIEDENNLTITGAYPMYDEVGMIQNPFTFRLINKGEESVNYILKLADITVGEKLDTNYVKYGFTKNGDRSISLLSTLDNNQIDSGIIAAGETIEYSLRLWIDMNVKDETLVAEKSLSYQIGIEAGPDDSVPYEQGPVSEKLFNSDNLGPNCKIYDDGVDTFLVGQCQNNYIWYSGKLWRVVLKNNETGAIKLVTDNAVTTLIYGNASFENSYPDQWLQQEFLPTLHNYEDYLVMDNIWDYTDNSKTPSRPTMEKTIIRTVGMLNNYEYYTTYNNSEGMANEGTTYLNNHSRWWTLTSGYYIYQTGGMNNQSVNSYGIRAVINMKPDIQIINGNGNLSNPYRLEKDIQITKNGATLLNTRYSGEYLTFNNQLYRIVNIENGLTKIISVNGIGESRTYNSNPYGGAIAVSFPGSSMKSFLESYYQDLDTTVKSMIEPNTKWYYAYGVSYKKTVCSTEDINISLKDCEKNTTTTEANIALPRIGEIFTSQIMRGTKHTFWGLGAGSGATASVVEGDGTFNGINNWNIGFVHPSMYLKSNVRIAGHNSGDGTYEHPYDILIEGFAINKNAAYTKTPKVTLELTGDSNLQICISNSEKCTNYESFATFKKWKLTPGDGEKIVHVYYKNSEGEITAHYSQSIILDEHAPTNNSIEISSEDNINRTLTLSSTGADYMCFSNTSSNISDCATWLDYTPTYKWVLSTGNGEKTVYAFFKDKAGNTANASATTSCTDCDIIMEDFEDSNYNNHFTITDGSTYPWVIRNGRFESNNKGQASSSSISSITFTTHSDWKLSFDYGVSSEASRDKLTITLTPSGGTAKNLVNAISGVNLGSIQNEQLIAGVTYTLTLTYLKDSSVDKNDDLAYIDNLSIMP